MQVSWGHGLHISSSPPSASARDKATGRGVTGPNVRQVASVAQSEGRKAAPDSCPAGAGQTGGSDHSEVQGPQMLCTQ